MRGDEIEGHLKDEVNCSLEQLNNCMIRAIKASESQGKVISREYKRLLFCFNYRSILNIESSGGGCFFINDIYAYWPTTGRYKLRGDFIKGKSNSIGEEDFISLVLSKSRNKHLGNLSNEIQHQNDFIKHQKETIRKMKKDIHLDQIEDHSCMTDKERFDTLGGLHSLLQDEYEELHSLNEANEKTIEILCKLRSIRDASEVELVAPVNRFSLFWGLISF